MNVHVLSSLLIVVATAAIAILQGQRLSDLKAEEVVIEQEARSLGLAVGGAPATKSDAAGGTGTSPAARGERTAGTRPGPRDPEAEGKAFADELFEFWKKMKEIETSGKEASREDKATMLAFINRFLELDAEVILHLMAEIRANGAIDDDDKREILGIALMTIAQSAPEKTMELYLNSSDLFGDQRRAEQMIGMALGAWAAQDPRATLDWLERNSASLEDKVVAGARKAAIANAFTRDPEFAVGLALELEKREIMELSQALGGLMPTPEAQLGLLRQLQDRLGALPADLARIDSDALESAGKDQILRGGLLVGLGNTLSRESFESARTFLEDANLDPVEMMVLAKGITSNTRHLEDPGAWLPWLHSHAPEAQRRQTVSEVVQNWTRQDFRSTAEWIGAQPPGPLREQATYSFAETVAPHEPASAAEWALTLPESPERTTLLQQIHAQWRGKDEAAAEAFAAEHGITP